jgi:hypothetical protein
MRELEVPVWDPEGETHDGEARLTIGHAMPLRGDELEAAIALAIFRNGEPALLDLARRMFRFDLCAKSLKATPPSGPDELLAEMARAQVARRLVHEAGGFGQLVVGMLIQRLDLHEDEAVIPALAVLRVLRLHQSGAFARVGERLVGRNKGATWATVLLAQRHPDLDDPCSLSDDKVRPAVEDLTGRIGNLTRKLMKAQVVDPSELFAAGLPIAVEKTDGLSDLGVVLGVLKGLGGKIQSEALREVKKNLQRHVVRDADGDRIELAGLPEVSTTLPDGTLPADARSDLALAPDVPSRDARGVRGLSWPTDTIEPLSQAEVLKRARKDPEAWKLYSTIKECKALEPKLKGKDRRACARKRQRARDKLEAMAKQRVKDRRKAMRSRREDRRKPVSK